MFRALFPVRSTSISSDCFFPTLVSFTPALFFYISTLPMMERFTCFHSSSTPSKRKLFLPLFISRVMPRLRLIWTIAVASQKQTH
ncbi:uncharacterized protein BO87DRAFT_167871 [Aspergillus neoniger CBS 115656]|uniref:Uncharacterized protein n=1 Tax=Aspergillus neoniger (strain CBS 115656) TaxID=1448310 RepID=A0A318YVC0_ASPNB|nr:hypothetical protein BO87DRAFT_167871 [Aspergillus neoniger CBS 115656]PYH38436.1 hypothetical protein BO87DRAFT_167871 [Aspergillus neoniger CBS 115656]